MYQAYCPLVFMVCELGGVQGLLSVRTVVAERWYLVCKYVTLPGCLSCDLQPVMLGLLSGSWRGVPSIFCLDLRARAFLVF